MKPWPILAASSGSSKLRSAARAERLVAASSWSRCRLTASSANSAATNSALRTISRTVTATTTGLGLSGANASNYQITQIVVKPEAGKTVTFDKSQFPNGKVQIEVTYQ